jgi:hypothetical protein
MKSFYVGFRIEVANRFIGRNFTRRFNGSGTNNKTKILELNREGKIVIEKADRMLIAHGQKVEKGMETGLSNFSLLVKQENEDQACRVIKIINVLGNDRLIRERVNVFVNGRSMLNAIPELEPLKAAFIKIERIAPGFIKSGWYYAPEAVFI